MSDGSFGERVTKKCPEDQKIAYMNGAMTEPWERTRTRLRISRTTMIGVSHHFFLTFRKSQTSPARLISFPFSVGFVRPAAWAVGLNILPVGIFLPVRPLLKRILA